MRPASFLVLPIAALCVLSPETMVGDPGAGSQVSDNQDGLALPSLIVWRNWRHDVRNSGWSPVVGAQTSAVKWNLWMWHERSSPVVGRNGTIYIGSVMDRLTAIRPSGTVQWVYSLPRNVFGSPAVGPDGIIYFGWTEELTALWPNGRRKWSLRPPGGVGTGSPIVGPDGTIYLGTWDYLWAIDPSGATKWQFFPDGDGDFGNHSPAVGRDGTVYMGSAYCYYDCAVYAINPDGSLRWKYTVDDPLGNNYFSGAPAIAPNGTVYIRNIEGVVFALNADGTERWRYQTEGEQFQSPALGRDGTIYIATGDGNNETAHVYALNPEGTLKWRYPAPPDLWWFDSSPTVGGDGTVYVSAYGQIGPLGTTGSAFLALDASGTLKWRYDVTASGLNSGSSAIGPDGTVYVGLAGYLHAFGPGPATR